MSSAIGIVAAVIGLVAVLAAAGLLVIVIRRSAAPRPAAVTPADADGEPARIAAVEVVPGGQHPPGGAARATEAGQGLDEASRAAEQVRAAAESDAAGIVRRAEEAAEKIAKACAEAEADLRAAKDEAGQLRTDLQRREDRLAERERRLDSELQKLGERSAALDAGRAGAGNPAGRAGPA